MDIHNLKSLVTGLSLTDRQSHASSATDLLGGFMQCSYRTNSEAIEELRFKLIEPVRKNMALIGPVIDRGRQAIGICYGNPPVSPVRETVKKVNSSLRVGVLLRLLLNLALVRKKLVVRCYAEAVYADVLNVNVKISREYDEAAALPGSVPSCDLNHFG